MLLSAIIPSFNRVSYLMPTLRVLTSQVASEEIEIIVVDSGNDGTEKMLQEFFPTVMCCRMPEIRNRSVLRNAGAELAKGDILLFIDNDMIIPPGYIEAHITSHENGNTVCLSKRKSLLDFSSDIVHPALFEKSIDVLEKLPYIEDVRNHDLRRFNRPFQSLPDPWRFTYSHGMSVRKDTFNKVGGFDPKFGENWGYEDVELGYRLFREDRRWIMLEGLDAYHQPHDKQSKRNNNQALVNRDIFARKHSAYQLELLLAFGPSISTLLYDLESILSNHRDDFLCSDDCSEELVWSCAYSHGNNPDPDRFKLGVLVLKNFAAAESIRILKGYFHLPIELQVNILYNAFRVSKRIIMELLNEESINLVKSFLYALGLETVYEQRGDVLDMTLVQKGRSRFINILLPGFIQVEQRFFMLNLALFLDQMGYWIILTDLEGQDNLDREDFSLSPSQKERLMKMKTGFYNSMCRTNIVSDNELMFLKIRKDAKIFVVRNRGYRKGFDAIKSGPSPDVFYIDEKTVDMLNAFFVRDSGTNRKTLPVPENRSSFLVFMQNGFYKDGIDVVLKAFSEIVSDGFQVDLIIKIPNFKNIAHNTYPSHNLSSKHINLLSARQNNELDLLRLNKLIEDLQLTDKVLIVDDSLAAEDRKRLYHSSIAFLCISTDYFLSIPAYEALASGVIVIAGQHKIFNERILADKLVHSVKSREVYFYESLHTIVEPETLGFFASVVEKTDLAETLKRCFLDRAKLVSSKPFPQDLKLKLEESFFRMLDSHSAALLGV